MYYAIYRYTHEVKEWYNIEYGWVAESINANVRGTVFHQEPTDLALTLERAYGYKVYINKLNV